MVKKRDVVVIPHHKFKTYRFPGKQFISSLNSNVSNNALRALAFRFVAIKSSSILYWLYKINYVEIKIYAKVQISFLFAMVKTYFYFHTIIMFVRSLYLNRWFKN